MCSTSFVLNKPRFWKLFLTEISTFSNVNVEVMNSVTAKKKNAWLSYNSVLKFFKTAVMSHGAHSVVKVPKAA